jgi:phenylpyruvate tautomerase PptA (4-oxalocrotonate tautomerase family)
LILESTVPLVRIDVSESTPDALAREVGEAVDRALTSVFGVPDGDKFQIVSRSRAGGRNLTTSYLGIDYTKDLVVIQITLNQGRSVALKKAFYAKVADSLTALGLRRQDVFISLVEVPRENWSFGNGEMQYAPE